MQKISNTLGLDVGDKRIGMAIVSDGLAIARSLPTLYRDSRVFDELERLCDQNKIEQIVMGLPRNMNGEDTAQTAAVRLFAKRLEQELDIPVVFQDEALTSHTAEEHMRQMGGTFKKGDVDAIAAQTILTDYLETQGV